MHQLEQATEKIREALMSGKTLTSRQANEIGNTADSRKIISNLHKRKIAIADSWVRTAGKRYKIYYCPGCAHPDARI